MRVLPLMFAIAWFALPTPAAAGVGDELAAMQEAVVDKRIAELKRAKADGADATSCGGSGGEVVVCGRRKETYRLDPDIMATESPDAPPRADPSRTVNAPRCSEGPHGCPGEGAIPVSAIALKVAQAGLAAVKGDDWKAVFRNGPDSYERYRRAKARREARR